MFGKMTKKSWLIVCTVIAVLFTGLGYWLHGDVKPDNNPDIVSDWWQAPGVPGTEVIYKDKIRTVTKPVLISGATVTISKTETVVQKGDTVYITRPCPPKPRLTFNSFAVEAGAGVVDIGTAPVIGYEAAFEYRPVTINVKSDISASIYVRAQADMSGADKQVDGQITAGIAIQF
jgi:hypothetical protein